MRNWREILPGKLALDQESWERHYRVWRMKQVGMSVREIATALGLSYSRAHQMLKRAERADYRALCPAERYFGRRDEPSLEKLRTMRPALKGRRPTFDLARIEAVKENRDWLRV